MIEIYTHDLGNESSEDLLLACGISLKNEYGTFRNLPHMLYHADHTGRHSLLYFSTLIFDEIVTNWTCCQE
jgi:hypothetical protein